MLKPGTLKSNFCKKLKNKFDLKKKGGEGDYLHVMNAMIIVNMHMIKTIYIMHNPPIH